MNVSNIQLSNSIHYSVHIFDSSHDHLMIHVISLFDPMIYIQVAALRSATIISDVMSYKADSLHSEI